MFKHTSKGIELFVKVTPKANQSEILGCKSNELHIRLAAVPDKGQANDELIKLLAKKIGVSKSQIEVLRGASSRHKCLLISGLNDFPEPFLKEIKQL